VPTLSDDDACDRKLSGRASPVHGECGGSIPTRSLHKDRDEFFDILGPEPQPVARGRALVYPILVSEARAFIEHWHSRLAVTPSGTIVAFGAFYLENLVAAALWGNCSARALPQDWRELRRMAVSDFAPKHTASLMINQMARWFKHNSAAPVLVSYQDLGEWRAKDGSSQTHTGTIYRASGWTPVAISRPRLRDRTAKDQPWVKAGRKMYRSNTKNLTPEGTTDAIASAKVRWQYSLRGEKFVALTREQIEEARLMKPTK
jgi:hypothetical protein